MNELHSVTANDKFSSAIQCSNCNSMLPSYAVFCGICGKRLEKDIDKMAVPWLWPAIIILSAIAAGFVTFVGQDVVVRPIIVTWFLFVCPGMTVVRFLRSGELIVQWTLAIALSCAIDGAVAGITLYAGKWSPTNILNILIVLSLSGAIAHFISLKSR